MSELKRALWVWTPRQLSHQDKKKELLDFCKREKVTHLYFQVIFSERAYPSFISRIEGQEYYRDLVREVHAAGMKIYALNSRSNAALKKEHARVMAEVKALVEYNKVSRVEEQFDGLHYAFNMYLLDGFNAKNIRAYLVQLMQISKRIRNYLFVRRPKITFSVDMPFWFLSGEKGPLPRFVFDLRWREAGEHLIDNVDEVVVFPYRNTFEGEDGIEALVHPSIEYANRVKKKVLIGVETMPISSQGASFASKGKKGLKDTEKLMIKKFKGIEGFGGIGINDYTNYHEMS